MTTPEPVLYQDRRTDDARLLATASREQGRSDTPSSRPLTSAEMVELQVQIIRETVEDNSWIPIQPHPPQLEFLASLEDEVLYGGAAGGGKSVALLAAAAQYVDVPGYSAVLFRRTSKDLKRAGGLIPLSIEWWKGTAAEYNATDQRWTFPSGATILLSHMENAVDRFDHRGAEYQFIGFDELTLFERLMYTYMFSRRRKRAGVNVPLRTRSGSNPGGIGHQWVKRRFLLERVPGRRFIPAKLGDNPSLDQEQYLRGLHELDSVELQQLRDGNWDVLESGGVFSTDALAKMSGDLRPPRVGVVRALPREVEL